MKHHPVQAWFSHLLISGTLVHEAKLEELREDYGLQVYPHVVMVVSIDRYPDIAEQKPMAWREDIAHTLVDVVSRCVTYPFTWIWTEEGVLALLVEVEKSECSPQVRDNRLVGVARDIQSSMKAVNTSVSIGIGTYYDNPGMLYASFQEAIGSMKGRFFQGNNLIFQYGQDVHLNDVSNEELAAAKTELLALFRIADEKGVASQVETLLAQLAESCQRNEDVFKSEVVDLVMMISRSVLESGVNAATILSKNVHFVHDLYKTIRYDKFVQKVVNYGVWLTTQVGQNQTPKVSPIVREAILYLKQQHRGNVSLEDVAKHCCMSKYHLSHLFKKEVGIGVIEFLNNVRVEKAAFYIQKTDFPMQQIASLVGFEDANYFSRIFKKYMRCSPTDYRTAALH